MMHYMINNTMVGNDAKNKGILDEQYICPACSLIIRDPIQFKNCGHRQCQSCFVDNQHRGIIKCPQCLTDISKEQLMIDRGFKNEIGSLPIECCLCEWTGVLDNYQDHLDRNHQNPKCDYCDTEFESVTKLSEHEVSNYQNTVVPCLLKDFGCNEQITRGEMMDHYSSEQHQNSLVKVHQQMSLNPIHTDLEIIFSLTDGSEIINGNGQFSINDLFQYQQKFQILPSDFFKLKLSVQESNC